MASLNLEGREASRRWRRAGRRGPAVASRDFLCRTVRPVVAAALAVVLEVRIGTDRRRQAAFLQLDVRPSVPPPSRVGRAAWTPECVTCISRRFARLRACASSSSAGTPSRYLRWE